MAKSFKKALKEEYQRLKKAFDKMVNPKKDQAMPSLVLQPVKNRRFPGN
ncbi:MAG: hypothetical protein NTW29_09255 [Bacteroidetes bacterium]|jgi:hypothetical protein|nr:hypothetical protein [Bacteroidota bacterium]